MLFRSKKFAMRGNVIDLAVGVIIGASFTGIVTSLVNDVIMPPIGLALGGVDFANFFFVLKGDRAVDTLAAAKGSVSLYRGASQSGVQMLSMHLGVMPIVSTVGGLPEYQPPALPPVGVDDVAGLTAAFDELADPLTATLRGAAAARHYADSFGVDRAADKLFNLLADVGRGAGKASA